MGNIREKLDKQTLSVLIVITQYPGPERSEIEEMLIKTHNLNKHQAVGWVSYAIPKLKRLGLIRYHRVGYSGWVLTKTGEDIATEVEYTFGDHGDGFSTKGGGA
jgi:RIO-like serine/threonine protein kinase